MHTISLPQTTLRKARLTIQSFVAALFAVKLRETLDVSSGGDNADAVWAWGL
jgi:hypothetical protein